MLSAMDINIIGKKTVALEFLISENACDFVCTICQEIHVNDNVTIKQCGHIFGHNCLIEMRKSTCPCHQKCPTCRVVFKKKHILVNKFAKRQLGNLRLKCTCENESCDWIGTINEYRYLQCPYEFITCPKPGCDILIRRIDLENHLKEKEFHFEQEIEYLKTEIKNLNDTNVENQNTIQNLQNVISNQLLIPTRSHGAGRMSRISIGGVGSGLPSAAVGINHHGNIFPQWIPIIARDFNNNAAPTTQNTEAEPAAAAAAATEFELIERVEERFSV